MLTPFGKALRQLRINKGLRLLDVANALKISSAFLSAVETGRRPIPDGFLVQLSRALNLTAVELRDLRGAVDRTRKEVRVDDLRGDQREMVAAFARKIDDLSPTVLEQLRQELQNQEHD
jgi:transcriptional regulator with XRE-family HTH domain